jgi:hypothetical protein
VLSLNSCFPVSCDLSCSVVLILTPRKPPQAAEALVKASPRNARRNTFKTGV